MPLSAGAVEVKIGGNISEYQRSLSQVVSLAQRTGQRLRAVGARMTAGITVPIVGAAAAAVKFASDVEESTSKAEAVFKDQIGVMREWADEHARSIGRSRFDLLNYAADVQDTFVPLGFAREEAAKMSREVVELSEDLASFKNLRTEDVVQGLTSALVGNVENLRQFGVVANEAQIKQQALRDGIIKTTKDALTPQQKALAIWHLTLAGTTDAQGDALRTAGSFANRLRALQARFKDVAVEIGQRLLPLASKLVEFAGDLLTWFQNLSPQVKNAAIVFAGLAAAIGPLALAIGALLTPIGLTVAAIAGLGAIGFVVVDNWEKVREWFKLFWQNMRSIAIAGAGLVVKSVIDQFAVLGNIQILPGTSINTLFPQFGQLFEDLKGNVDELVATIGGPEASGRMKQMQALLDDLREGVSNFTFDGMIDGLKRFGEGAGRTLKGFIQPLIDAIEELQNLMGQGAAAAGGGPLRAGVGFGNLLGGGANLSGLGVLGGGPAGANLSGLGVLGGGGTGFSFDRSGFQASLDIFNARMKRTGNSASRFGEELKTLGQQQLKGFADSVGSATADLIVFGRSLKDTILSLVQTAAQSAVGGFVSLGLKSILPFQHGGIVRRPTIGLIGEAGPEAVVPLSKGAGLPTAVPDSMSFRVGDMGDLVVEIERWKIVHGIE